MMTTQELLARIDALAAISAMEGGLLRAYLTDEHRRANELVATWMQQAGMSTWQDQAGNQWGRYEGSEAGAKALIIGSHLDTVPNAGRYDGMLGVLLGIAAVDHFNRLGQRFPFAIEVVGFGDEEGTRFGSTLLGSRAVSGSWLQEWFAIADKQGVTMADAFKAFGLDPAEVGKAARHADDVKAYIEVHIEQGVVLESKDLQLGTVTAIAGARRKQVVVKGRAGHAGTTPMDLRFDALVMAAHAITMIERKAKIWNLVATVGRVECLPNAVNVIPGEVRFSVDIRSQDDHERDRAWAEMEAGIRTIVGSRNGDVSISDTHAAPAVPCADWLQQSFNDALAEHGHKAFSLVSGAGHDAMAMADITDVGMLFLRSPGGISHHPAESVIEDDVRASLEVLISAIGRIASH
ncbi:allantoate amidohydrolase [Pokkaliibacter plantistimulans]|uniref:Allantoate amidohydrolase n=1 Tax=Proteobacteria bacterium 228 TaxID=2083153 RepID=A0A2S5KVK5_9PROT|nr:allantoate amidohydrolase [Pokkaliibacter plantistimulans]PPC78682.1 allantoate amidohydrolase [Pokkaliibacter plantistimulans]